MEGATHIPHETPRKVWQARDQGKGLQGYMPRGSMGMKESVRERTLTLPRELPLWEFGVPVDSQIFRGQLQGSKPNGLKSSLYH
jgi:hypothetical protein